MSCARLPTFIQSISTLFEPLSISSPCPEYQQTCKREGSACKKEKYTPDSCSHVQASQTHPCKLCSELCNHPLLQIKLASTCFTPFCRPKGCEPLQPAWNKQCQRSNETYSSPCESHIQQRNIWVPEKQCGSTVAPGYFPGI